ncbi:MAG: cytochrome c3 family protein [Verrucomicrobia bacterium]|nr:cytochrome c3 family protein [Verrucomicrobiota bacterium]
MRGSVPKPTARTPRHIAAAALVSLGAAAAALAYYFTPEYSRVGYAPIQPVAFSHRTHVGELGMDCRYCHDAAERAERANLPPASTCMDCHNQILIDDPRLAPLQEAVQTERPLPWIRVHALPDYVAFSHAAHLRRGVACVECHGRVDRTDRTREEKSLSMRFCLDCHRAPETRLRPLEKVFDPTWTPPKGEEGAALSKALARRWSVRRLTDCSACHR